MWFRKRLWVELWLNKNTATSSRRDPCQQSCHARYSCAGFRLQSCSQQLCMSQVRTSVRLFLINSPQNLCNFSVEDSCSSSLVGRKSKRTIETPTPASSTTVTIQSTTVNDSTMTDSSETERSTTTAPKNDKTFKQDEYSHVELCEGLYETDFCLNNGTCYIHKYRDAQIYVCDCTSHYVGQRCEEKSLEGSYGGGMKLRIRRRTNKKFRRRRISSMFSFMSCCFCLVFCY